MPTTSEGDRTSAWTVGSRARCSVATNCPERCPAGFRAGAKTVSRENGSAKATRGPGSDHAVRDLRRHAELQVQRNARVILRWSCYACKASPLCEDWSLTYGGHVQSRMYGARSLRRKDSDHELLEKHFFNGILDRHAKNEFS